MKIVGFKIPVLDLDKAIEFYVGVLGFSLAFRADEFGWLTLQHETVQFGLYIPGQGGGTRKPGGSIDFSFSIEDIVSLQTNLKKNSALVSDIADTADGMQVIDVTDPFGNVITFRKQNN